MDFGKELERIEIRCRRLLGAGQDEQAIAVARDALERARRRPGPEHPFTINLTDHLAGLLTHLGRPQEAIPLREQALAHKRHHLGAHALVAEAANNLAELYRQSGRYAEARGLYLEALDIEHHPVVWQNLGLLYTQVGALDDAEACLRHGLAGDLEALGPDDPNTAISRDNLAQALFTKAAAIDGEAAVALREEARVLMDEAVQVFRQSAPPRTLLRGLINRALNLVPLGRHTEAVAAAREAVALAHRVAPASELLCDARLALADALAADGDSEAAYDELLALWPGERESPQAARVASAAAERAWEDARWDEAARWLPEALARGAQHVAAQAAVHFESERVRRARALWRDAERLLALALAGSDAVAPAAALEAALRYKGAEDDVERLHAATIRNAGDDALRSAAQALADGQRTLVELALRGPGVELSPFLDAVAQTERDTAIAEGALAGALTASGARAALEAALTDWWQSVDLASLARWLGPRRVLTWYLRVADREGQTRYLAATVTGEAQVALLDLGPAEDVDALVPAALAAVDAPVREAVLDAPETATPESLRTLTQALWTPVAARHPGVTRWVVVPDAALWSVPFDALPLDDGAPLIATHALSLARSPRNLLRPRGKPEAAGPPLIVGDPRYALDREVQLEASVIAALPGTGDECRDVAATLGVAPLTGRAAVKGAVTGALRPCVLHLATHGVYDLDNVAKLRRFSPMPWAVMNDKLIGDGYRSRRLLWESNPMYRSLLIFAGASDFLDGHDAGPPVGNGLLTAAELSQLDLRATELVVLSACNTLCGDVRSGAVRGLSSALARAGARAAVLSLWPVPDQATARLMGAFYRRLLAGDGRAQALRDAKLALRADGAPPWAWAGFALLGDPGSLPAFLLDAARSGTAAGQRV